MLLARSEHPSHPEPTGCACSAALPQAGCPLHVAKRSTPKCQNFRLNGIGIPIGLAPGFGRQVRFCKPPSPPAPGPCDPRSSLTAVNHLFWFLPTRRLAAAEAVGVGEMHASWAGASPAGCENRCPTGPWPCRSISSCLLPLRILYGSNLLCPITQGCTRGSVAWLRRRRQRWRLKRELRSASCWNELPKAGVWQSFGTPHPLLLPHHLPIPCLLPAQHPSPISFLAIFPCAVPPSGQGAIFPTANLGCSSGSCVPGPELETLILTGVWNETVEILFLQQAL